MHKTVHGVTGKESQVTNEMEITVAKSAGFCFGVKRAVSLVYEETEKRKAGDMRERPVYTIGPIIHNEIVVNDLRNKGVRVLGDDLNRVEDGEPPEPGSTVIIRSHGIPKEMHENLSRQGLHVVDATCPFVRKIHDIVDEKSREGYAIVIIGDPSHPEVIGIRGWAGSDCYVVMTSDDIAKLKSIKKDRLCIVAQTTFNFRKFQELVEIIGKLGYDVVVMNTICNATRERQIEAMELAGSSDVMLVIGGHNSSNTQKLFDICRSQCGRTWFVSDPDDLRDIHFEARDKVGITAGASTPNTIIQEVSQHVRRAEL